MNLHRLTLVLNASYEPLNVCSLRRAHVLVFKGKAEVIEELDRPLCSATKRFPWPHVIRLLSYVRVPRIVQRKISRRALFARPRESDHADVSNASDRLAQSRKQSAS